MEFEIQPISKHGIEEIKIIQEEAKKYPQIEKIYLFGSCARKEDNEKSDLRYTNYLERLADRLRMAKKF